MKPDYTELTKIDTIIVSQRKFKKESPNPDFGFRMNNLKLLKRIIIENEADIINALYKDLNKPEIESLTAEIGIAIQEINYTIKNLRKWMKKKKVKSNLVNYFSSSYTVMEPYGNTLIIGPWNYPFQLAISPLIGAIAGGNTAIVKPSEMSINTSLVLENIINSNFDENYVQVVRGGISETSHLLDKRFDLIFFTGSTKVGKIIMEKASKHLTPVVLELGGKSPAIIDKSADLEKIVKRLVYGKTINSGQTCVAPDYVLIHEDIKEEFYHQFKLTVDGMFVKGFLANNDYGKIINEQNYMRVKNYLNDGMIIFGGEFDDSNHKIELTLLEVDKHDSNIMKDEIFGPLLPVVTFNTTANVFDIVAYNPDPLALYVFSEDTNFVENILTNIHFGGGCVNDTIMHLSNEHLPFGGRGQSGIGAYHGKYSFDSFSHKKSIIDNRGKFDLGLKFPPYKSNSLKWVRKFIYR